MLILLENGLHEAKSLVIKPEIVGANAREQKKLKPIHKLVCVLDSSSSPVVLADNLTFPAAQSLLQSLISNRKGDIFVATASLLANLTAFK